MRISKEALTPKISNGLLSILKSIASSRTHAVSIVQRAKLFLLSVEGKPNKEIAPEIDLHVNNAGKWRRRFLGSMEAFEVIEREEPEKLEQNVIELLSDAHRAGTKPTYTADQRTFIITIACQNPEDHGFELSHWNLTALKQVATQKGIVEDISVATINRILNENEIRPHKIQYWLHSTEKAEDPESCKEKVNAINNAYALAHEIASSESQQKIRILSTDEMTGVQALERKFPDKPTKPKMVAKREFEYIRHGTLSLTAFFDVVTGKVEPPYVNATRTADDFVSALDKVLASDDNHEYEWIIIADNLNTHYSSALVRYIAKKLNYDGDLGKEGKDGILKSKQSRIEFLTDHNHRIHFLYTPIYCSWMNQIEIWFGIINRQLLKRKSYMSVEELAASICRFIDLYNLLLHIRSSGNMQQRLWAINFFIPGITHYLRNRVLV